MQKEPSVSVIIANHNYGRYIGECIESVLAQSHKNIEVYISDNASTDMSWEVINSFDKKFPGKFSIAKNNRNKGAQFNYRTWFSQISSDYRITLTSDDILDVNYVKRSVELLEKHKECAFLITHQSSVAKNGTSSTLKPFFNQSCILFPPGLSLLYMVASVNPTLSQVVYRVPRTPYDQRVPLSEEGPYREFFRARVNDFLLSLHNPVIYLNEPLVKHRVHNQMHTVTAEKYMMNIMGAYGLAFEFLDYVRIRAPEYLEKFEEQLPIAIKKHAFTALRYCTRFIIDKEPELAEKYLLLARSIDPSISRGEVAKKLEEILSETDSKKKISKLEILKQTPDLITRTISYDPPQPFKAIE